MSNHKRGALKKVCYAIVSNKVIKYESITQAAIENDFDFSQISIARMRAVDTGELSFVVDGMRFYLIEPVIVGSHTKSIHLTVKRKGGPLLPGLITHGLGQLWRY